MKEKEEKERAEREKEINDKRDEIKRLHKEMLKQK